MTYKAIILFHAYGGWDAYNTLVPYDTTGNAAYLAKRSTIGIPRASLTSTALSPSVALAANAQAASPALALHPNLSPLKAIFDAGKLAGVLNMGALIQPTNKTQALTGGYPLPAGLFSHNDQQNQVQSDQGIEGTGTGWGGRIADKVLSLNANPILTCVNPSINAVFEVGTNALQYCIGPSGATYYEGIYPNRTDGLTIVTESRSHEMMNALNATRARAIAAYDLINTQLALADPTAAPFNTFSDNIDLEAQLKVICRMISRQAGFGNNRNVFFCQSGGYDTHSNQTAALNGLHTKFGNAVSKLWAALGVMGMQDNVLFMSIADFGRTLLENTQGSDHAWGSHHFVMGGAVNGGRFYGEAPVYADNGVDDIGQGILVPKISITQYAYTAAKWFGLTDAECLEILPRAANWTAGTGVDKRNLGFI